jgi:hypothetical protein
MIKHILAVGDSFTYGEELDDRYLAYPYVIARHLDAEVVNLGAPGTGNRRMVRTVMEYIASDTPVDLVIIGWSSPGRMEFADAEGIFDIWPGYAGNLFVRDQQLWRLELLQYINMYHDPEYLFTQYLMDVILLQNFLKQRGIRYLMCDVCANEYYHKICAGKLQEFKAMLDTNHFVGYPNAGMAEWTYKCKKGPNGHFLDEGHFKVADELLTNIDRLGWSKQ